MTPFTFSDLVLSSYSISGASDLLSNVDQVIRLQCASSVCFEYKDWDSEQGFGGSDMTYAVQRFLDKVIDHSGLPYKTRFNPVLEVVENR